MKAAYVTTLFRLASSLVFTTAGLLTAPLLARAETVEFTRTSEPTAPRKAARVGLNENGDLIARFDAVTVTVAYNPPDPTTTLRDTVRQIQRQELPQINGIGFQIALSF